MNQVYSRLSTTHGHITDCKLDSVVSCGCKETETLYPLGHYKTTHQFRNLSSLRLTTGLEGDQWLGWGSLKHLSPSFHFNQILSHSNLLRSVACHNLDLSRFENSHPSLSAFLPYVPTPNRDALTSKSSRHFGAAVSWSRRLVIRILY